MPPPQKKNAPFISTHIPYIFFRPVSEINKQGRFKDLSEGGARFFRNKKFERKFFLLKRLKKSQN